MRKERILAVIMSVLLALSMISATVFAAEIPALDGKLKIQGTAAEGRTLSAEFKEVKPEGVTEDDVAYLSPSPKQSDLIPTLFHTIVIVSK